MRSTWWHSWHHALPWGDTADTAAGRAAESAVPGQRPAVWSRAVDGAVGRCVCSESASCQSSADTSEVSHGASVTAASETSAVVDDEESYSLLSGGKEKCTTFLPHFYFDWTKSWITMHQRDHLITLFQRTSLGYFPPTSSASPHSTASPLRRVPFPNIIMHCRCKWCPYSSCSFL